MERRPEIEGTWTADEVAEWNVRWDAAENDYGERILLEAMAESGVYTPKADSPPPSPESEAMAPPVVTEEPTPAPSIKDVGIAGLGTRRSVGPLTGPLLRLDWFGAVRRYESRATRISLELFLTFGIR